MPIKNYTTSIDVYQSLGEIQGALASHGANKIMVDYENGRPTAISFALVSNGEYRGFILPATVDGTLRAFEKGRIKADRAQAERTAWRNVRDWVLAQMALIESCDMPIDEPFLPYLANRERQTLYQLYSGGRLMLNG